MVIEHAFNQIVKSYEKDQQTDIVSQVFKVVKEKMVNLILKDTNASVRDATVSLFITFKSILRDDTQYP